jgi:hypothetical protein
LEDLLRRVGREFYRVRLADVGGPAHVAPSAVLGKELLVKTDRAFDSVHPERQVIRNIAASGDLNDDAAAHAGSPAGRNVLQDSPERSPRGAHDEYRGPHDPSSRTAHEVGEGRLHRAEVPEIHKIYVSQAAPVALLIMQGSIA